MSVPSSAADATLLSLLAARVYPADGVPQHARRPYAVLVALATEKDEDLEGVVDQRIGQVRIEVAADTEASLQAVLDRIDTDGILSNRSGTIAGVSVVDTDVDEVSDVPDEPVDLDDGEAFVGEALVSVAYR